MSSCCNCCAFTSLIGVVFFGITATMVKRENTVFLTHKAGIGLHDITEDNVNAKFMVMVYTAVVFLAAMILCFSSAWCLKRREDRLSQELEMIRARKASIAFEGDDDGFKAQ